MLAHEWHPAQLFILLTMPLFKLYCAINGSTDGCVLFMRICYVVFAAAAACTFYGVLSRSINPKLALAAALVLQVYDKSGIHTLSYYTMALVFYTGVGVCIYQYLQTRRRRYALISGISFAVSTLCIPYLAVAFALVVIAVAVLCIIRPGVRRELLRFVLWMMLGLSAVFAAFCVFFAATVPLGDFAYSLPNVFMDPKHVSSTYLADTLLQLRRVAVNSGKLTLVALALVALYALVKRLRGQENPIRRRVLIYIVTTALVLANIALVHSDYYILAMTLTGLIVYLLTQNPDDRLFCALYLSGFVLSAACYFSSDTGLTAICVGLLPSMLASFLMIGRFMEECQVDHEPGSASMPLRVASLALCGVVVLMLGYRRVGLVYRDAPLNLLNTRIEQGPAAGIYSTAKRVQDYDRILTVVHKYAQGEDMVIVMPFVPWVYLSTDMRCASPTIWRMFTDDFRFERYYSRYPERRPDVLFALDPALVQYASMEEGRTGSLLEKEGFFTRYIEGIEFDKIDTDCGTVYVRKGYSDALQTQSANRQ